LAAVSSAITALTRSPCTVSRGRSAQQPLDLRIALAGPPSSGNPVAVDLACTMTAQLGRDLSGSGIAYFAVSSAVGCILPPGLSAINLRTRYAWHAPRATFLRAVAARVAMRSAIRL